MKRRSFIAKGIAGAVGAGFAGCSTGRSNKILLEKKLSPFVARPRGGTMPMGELGKTGIKISKFGFGSHIRAEMVTYYEQREHMIHEAYDLGVNVFDVYDEEKGSSLAGSYQYEPFGRQINPFKNDILISISFRPYDGRTPEEEFERDLRLFGRDHIDLVRLLREPNHPWYEKLLKWKEQGKIRAVGSPVHTWEHIDMILGKVPLDFIIFPYNFYHNICWVNDQAKDYESLPAKLREHGVGVITMKPFAGDYLCEPFIDVARHFVDEPQIKFPQAALRYIINSGIDAESTFTGMYQLPHLYENVEAYYNPAMSDEEKQLLGKIRDVATMQAANWLPPHYRFLNQWAGDVSGNTGETV